MASRIVTPQRPGPPAVVNAQISQQLQVQREMLIRAKNHIAGLEGELATLEMRRKQMASWIICILRSHECFKDGARFKAAMLDEIAPDVGVDSGRDDSTDEIIVRLMTAAEHQKRIAGYLDGKQDMQVPKKPPFECKIDIPVGGRLAFVHAMNYVGGKSDGKELVYTPNRPKKPRDFTVEERGADHWVKFTTDSAGMTVRIVFSFKVAVEEEKESSNAPLEYVNAECKAWHESESDGVKIIGRFCPVCGDSRNVLSEQV